MTPGWHEAVKAVRPTKQRRQQLAVFRNLLDPNNVLHGIVRVSCQDGNIVRFNFERQGAVSGFSEREVAVANRVIPFLHILEQRARLQILERRPRPTEEDTGSEDSLREQGLRPREAQFASLAIKGLSYREIARVAADPGCDLGEQYVKNTMTRVFEKLGVTNRKELAYEASGWSAQGGTQRSTPRPEKHASLPGTLRSGKGSRLSQ